MSPFNEIIQIEQKQILISLLATIHGNNLLTFGGTGVPFGDGASNRLFACNLRTMKWQHIRCAGNPPIRIYGHASRHFILFLKF